MAEYKRALIAGVGLLGGSIALALRKYDLAESVMGWGRDEAKLDAALQQGVIQSKSTDLDEAATLADLIIVCTPVRLVPKIVLSCVRHCSPETLLTDVGSTKQQIAAQLAEVPAFCGSHPLAGGEKSGSEHANADLFQGRTCIVTPLQSTAPEVVLRAAKLWKNVGARTLKMTPHQHDAALARTSHLPHIVAACLAGATPKELLPLAATGWADTTRVAAGGVELWLQIIQENRLPILEALQGFGKSLEQWTEAVEQDDSQKLTALLTTGKDTRDSLGN